MLNGGKFNAYLQNGLWAEAVNIIMLLKNNLLTPNRTLATFNNFQEGKEKHPVFDEKNLVKYTSPTKTNTLTRLS